jgi:hypothetical protein
LAPTTCAKEKIWREYQINALIGGYDVWEVMLDLGLDVKILQNISWEFME